MAIRKFSEDGLIVVADRSQPNAMLPKPRLRALQLDQLQLAKGSPIGGAEKQQDKSIPVLERFKILVLAELIRTGQLWDPGSNPEAGTGSISGSDLLRR